MITIESMQSSDWEAVERIYAEGIATRNATFETETPSWEAWHASKHIHSRLVAKLDGKVVGWAALSPVSKRAVYAGVSELSVYVGAEARGMGVGSLLLGALIESSENAGIWTLTTSIFPENEASIHIHQKHGFQILGRRKGIANHFGTWRDTLIMERRSQVVGVD
jgi:phosphinothricin acetyltransferase